MKTARLENTETVETHMFTREDLLKVLLPTVPAGASVEIRYDQDELESNVWIDYPVVIVVTTKTVSEGTG